MAQKKITIELTNAEAAHLQTAITSANAVHQEEMKRSNPALDRVAKKLLEAQASDEPEEVSTAD